MDNQIMRLLGKRVRVLRKKKGLSQEGLGEKAGFHFSYIGGIERAEKNITLLNLIKIADALDVTVHELLVSSKYNKRSLNEHDKLMNTINEQLMGMNTTTLNKVNLLLNELFNN